MPGPPIKHQENGVKRKHGHWDLSRERRIFRDEGHDLHGDQKHVGAMLHQEIPPSELNGWLPPCLWVLPTAISSLWELFLDKGSHLALPQLHPCPETTHIWRSGPFSQCGTQKGHPRSRTPRGLAGASIVTTLHP